MSDREIWACPEPGCDYRAGMLPTTDQVMVLNLHYARAHPGLLTIEGAGHPEFSEGAYEVTDTADPFSLHANARAYDFPPEDEVDGSAYTKDPDWKERLVTNGPVIIWDDPPPDPDRPFDQDTILEWYRTRAPASAHRPEADDDEFAARLIDHGLNDDGTPWALIQGDADDLADWRARLERYIHRPPETEFADPEVRCGTWLVPAAFALAAAGVVYLSYRWTGR